MKGVVFTTISYVTASSIKFKEYPEIIQNMKVTIVKLNFNSKLHKCEQHSKVITHSRKLMFNSTKYEIFSHFPSALVGGSEDSVSANRRPSWSGWVILY